ncbi:hypothetical protein FQZ97_966510 [compost metagenome]
MLAAQQQAHIGFRQQDLGDFVENGGLVLADPGNLGRGEAGHGDIAGKLAQIGERRFHFAALGGRAAVVPQDGWAQHLIAGIEQGGAMHVAGQADAAHRSQLGWMCLAERVYGGERCRPPIGGVLLGPAGMGADRFHRRSRRVAQRAAMRVNEQRLDAGCADINTETSHEARTS